MNKQLSCFFVFLFFTLSSTLIAQQFANLDPEWDKYYDINPSGIMNNHQASDFIAVIDKVGFIPQMSEFNQDVKLLKRVLLSLGQDSLNQMAISGDYYSRTKKHTHYFLLYNKIYKKIDKMTWQRFCPYLLPLMDIDGQISLD